MNLCLQYFIYLSIYLSTYLSISVYLSIYLSIYLYLWLYSPLLDLGFYFSFLIFYIVGRTSLTGDQPVARPLPTHKKDTDTEKTPQTSMPWVEFEPPDPSLRASEDSSCLRRRGHCYRHFLCTCTKLILRTSTCGKLATTRRENTYRPMLFGSKLTNI
jgi:hypothetical protein